MLETFQFKVAFARRIPDPNFHKTHGTERHIFMVPVSAVPKGIGLDPNARSPNIKKRVYQKVEESLLERDGSPLGTFHLKNKGITIVAHSVESLGDDLYAVRLETGLHGIVDGGHTYELISQNQTNPDLPGDQFVNVEVRVGIPVDWIPEIAGGLNTSVQVQDMSLDNLAGKFQWIKDTVRNEPYYDQIAWSENDKGEFDARDIISMLLCLNVALFPNEKEEHPVSAYEKKSTALKLFEEQTASFERMRPILKDILRLHDIIGAEAKSLYNNTPGSKGGALAFVDHKKRGKYDFPFSGAKEAYRLAPGALYPMLAAFRWYVVDDPKTLKMRWRDGFSAVLKAWRELGEDLMRATQQTSNELGRNPQSIGKSRNHWSNLHGRVVKFDLMQQHPIPSE